MLLYSSSSLGCRFCPRKVQLLQWWKPWNFSGNSKIVTTKFRTQPKPSRLHRLTRKISSCTLRRFRTRNYPRPPPNRRIYHLCIRFLEKKIHRYEFYNCIKFFKGFNSINAHQRNQSGKVAVYAKTGEIWTGNRTPNDCCGRKVETGST